MSSKLASGWILYALSKAEPEAKIIQQHARLVKRIAKNLLGRLPACVQLEDLIQAGMIGLLEAAKNYDASKGAHFDTYASIRIRGAMLDEIRKSDWAPRSVHRNSRRIAQAIREIENQTGRDARDEEVAKNLEISLQGYHRLLRETSINKIFNFDEVSLNEDNLLEENQVAFNGPLDGLQQASFKKSLEKGIESLPERERLVLTLYYEEELNLREVGEILGVSESRVSQIHSQAMAKLQMRLREWSV